MNICVLPCLIRRARQHVLVGVEVACANMRKHTCFQSMKLMRQSRHENSAGESAGQLS